MFTRDYLTDLLWHTAAPRLANHSLAQGLSVIKAKVAREAVLIQRATVGLAPGWIDVDAQQLTSGAAEIAGPFLDGFDIQAARPFEEWKEEYRARLVPQLRDCLVRQMDAARRIGDFATVERRAERLYQLDPLAEEAVRGVMEARAWAGDRSNALKAFARYEARLAEELAAKPSADLSRVADLLRDGRRPAPPGAAADAPLARMERRFEPETLIGREREFSVLYDAWLEARRKHPRIVVLTSDPGVGKTTLANAFVSSCQMDGAVVARAQAYDAERELPFAVLGELVRQLASQRAIGGADPEALSELTRISTEILRVFPGVPKPVAWSPEITPLRLADAFLKTVTAAADDSPVVLVVDDIHAADNASTAILHVVARKLAEARVLLILTGRTSELRLSGAPAALTSDHAIGGIRTLEMDVLPPDAAERLVRQLAAAAGHADPPVERILRAGGGNPLALELITREWAAHGPASLLRDLEALDTQPVPALGIPRAIGAVFERQSRRLDRATRAALDLAAVLGRRLTDVELFRAVELAPGQAAEALSRLKDEGFLREVRGDLEFRNELIRAQAYYAVAGAVRQHLHRVVATLLRSRPRQDDKAVTLEIGWHYLRGGQIDNAVPFAHAGAEALLSVGAPQEAEGILQAISDADKTAPSWRKTQILLGRALLDQSKADAAVPVLGALQDEEGNLTLVEQAELARLRASAEYSLNREPGGRYCELAYRALDVSKKTRDPELIARALFEYARAGSEAGLPELVRVAQAGIEELASTAETSLLRMVYLTRGFCNLFWFKLDVALEDLRRAAEVNLPEENKASQAFVLAGIGTSLTLLARLTEARAAFLAALDLARTVGDDARASMIASNLCLLHVARGEYSEATRFGELSIEWGTGGSTSNPILVISYTNLADAYILQGKADLASQCIERAREWLNSERRWRVRCALLIAVATFALTQGNVALALDVIAQMENWARGREEAFPLPGSFWKLKLYRQAHLGQDEAVLRNASRIADDLQAKCPFYYLDVLAAKAWLERRLLGGHTTQTDTELEAFTRLGMPGKRALLTAQGFLLPTQSPLLRNGEPAATLPPSPG